MVSKEKRLELLAKADKIFVAKRDGADLSAFLEETKIQFKAVQNDLKKAKKAFEANPSSDVTQKIYEENLEKFTRLENYLKKTLTHSKLAANLEAEIKDKMKKEQQQAIGYTTWMETCNFVLTYMKNKQFRKDYKWRALQEVRGELDQKASQSSKQLSEMLKEQRDMGVGSYESYGQSMGQMFNTAMRCGDIIAALVPWAGIGTAIGRNITKSIKSSILNMRTERYTPLSLPEVRYFVDVDNQGRLSLDGLKDNFIRSDGGSFSEDQAAAFYGGVLAWLEDNDYEAKVDQNGNYEIDNDGMIQIGRYANGNFTPITKQDFEDLRDHHRYGLQTFIEGKYEFNVRPAAGPIR